MKTADRLATVPERLEADVIIPNQLPNILVTEAETISATVPVQEAQVLPNSDESSSAAL